MPRQRRFWFPYPVLAILLAVGLLPLGALTAGAQGVILPPTRCFDLPVPLLVPEPVPLPRVETPDTGADPGVTTQFFAPQQIAPPVVQPPVIQPPIIRPPIVPPPPILPCWLTLTSHTVAVQIQDQVATTRVDQVFRNDTGRDLEGTYVFPLPEDATVTSFSMFVDGRQITGEVLSREDARRLYESIVRANRDPALLEFAGRGAFQANVFPVPAGGQRTLRLEYSQVLPRDSGLVRYVYPTAAERLSARPSQETSFSVSITSAQPLRSIYSPTHDVAVTRSGENAATATWSSKTDRTAQSSVRKQFELVYAVSPDPVGLSIATTKPTNEDGYFLLLAAPSLQMASSAALPKDVTLVFDTSGSMAGAKIEQARAALRYVLNSLNPADRYSVVAFSSTVNPLNGGMRPASERAQGLAFVDGLVAAGGTNIYDALVAGLTPDAVTSGSSDAGARPHIVVFVTDGLPTVGPQDPEQLIAGARKAAGGASRSRVFTFGVGYDVNTTLLDKLAADFGGVSAYVRPEDNLEEAVSTFFTKVSSPVLTDLALDFGGPTGADVYDVHPVRLPDLYAGTQLVVAGRYRRAGTFDVTLRGVAAGQTQSFTLRGATFAAGPVKAQEALPRLWAGRKIAFLLSEIRLRGAAKELVDEVVSLATRYGIATPYTSIFVPEPTVSIRPGVPAATPAPLNTDAGRAQAAEALRQGVAAAPSSGVTAVQDSTLTNLLGQAQSVQSATGPGVQTVADKTFQLVDGVWNDLSAGTPPPPDARNQIVFGSEAYFGLLDAHPNAPAYLSVGTRVVFELNGQWYEVVEQ
ncbi:MAG TPA: VIT domain-containing protein [Chloroflexota bacterium]|nr:VIT domain-containing protein [Chloroflexota bacterium]